MSTHQYKTYLNWTGNLGKGTKNYRVYSRDHEISTEGGLLPIPGSSDPAFRGDPERYNPEELLLASLSACHMLWYLHLCAVNKVVVTAYSDQATAEMEENEDGSGQFSRATLFPEVTVETVEMQEKALQLHHEAAKLCFIARSVNFSVSHEPVVSIAF